MFSQSSLHWIEKVRKEGWRFHLHEFESGDKWKASITNTKKEYIEIHGYGETADTAVLDLFNTFNVEPNWLVV